VATRSPSEKNERKKKHDLLATKFSIKKKKRKKHNLVDTKSILFFLHLETWWPSSCSTLNFEGQSGGHHIVFFFAWKRGSHQII
jgi:hypothetical protein